MWCQGAQSQAELSLLLPAAAGMLHIQIQDVSPNKPQHQTTVMFNFLFSQELVLSRELKSLLLQGPGALLMHLPISLQSPLTKGYLDFFLEKSLITQGNDTAAAAVPASLRVLSPFVGCISLWAISRAASLPAPPGIQLHTSCRDARFAALSCQCLQEFNKHFN